MHYQRTLAGTGQHEIEIKRSRFICTVARVAAESEAREQLAQIRRRHPGANHHCFAFVIGAGAELQRMSDDGEPSGTAGMPILEVLKRRQLTDSLAVVTRYFGGTLLGAGGLVRAYSRAVTETIDAVGIVELRPLELLSVQAGYDDAGRLEHALRTSPYPPVAVVRGAEVTFTFHLPPEKTEPFRAWLGEHSGGRQEAQSAGRVFAEVRV